LAQAPPSPPLGGEPAKLDQPGLVRVQFQPELRQPLAKLDCEPLGVFPPFKPNDEIVGPAYDDHFTAAGPTPPPSGPPLQDVVRVHVSEQRRYRSPLR